MNENPLLILLFVAGSVYIFSLWLKDYRLQERQRIDDPKALPGAHPATIGIVIVGILGSLMLVAIETAGEYAWGTVQEQSTITYLYLLAMLAAGFVEELIFRGYLFIDKRGQGVLWASIFTFSLIFALLHTQYYITIPEDQSWTQFQFNITTQSVWTLGILFLNSMWFYVLRFGRWNPRRSLIPCIAAHMASNLAVFLVKLSQGFVSGLY